VNPRLRWLGALAAVAVLVAAAWLARAPMRITLVNTTLRIDDPWTRAAAFALAGCGLVALATALPGARLRIQRCLLVASAVFTLGVAAANASTWLEARPEVLTARRWFLLTTVPWNEVSRVDSWRDAVVVWSASGARVVIDARRLDAQQRAVLERTIARHVREGAMVSGR
jgi:hypothetical protein